MSAGSASMTPLSPGPGAEAGLAVSATACRNCGASSWFSEVIVPKRGAYPTDM
ncbi:hypothetical protein [Trebonia sp.]|uniref:hypothetical protein n=1 Tax=Trebonia sp. TaxID=2767075 RepID=UPI002602BA19|nr:hypothetical protein [Trebonia sp.]